MEENKKYFVFSDIHGRNPRILNDALIEKGFDLNNDNHIIVSLGDLFDRGTNNIDVLEFVMKYYKKGRAILLWGNHEFILKDLIDAYYNNDESTIWVYLQNWTVNGTMTTAIEFLKYLNQYNVDILPQEQNFKALKYFTLLNEYFSVLKPFVSIGDYLMCHSGCTNYDPEATLKDIEAETWNITKKDMQYSDIKNVPFNKHGHKKVMFGHMHTIHYHDSHDIYEDDDMIVLDSYKQINIYVVEENL